MKFFFDENVSPHLAAGLRAFGEDVVHIREEFPEGTSDEDWLSYVGRERLFLVTRDIRIRWRPNELQALKDHKVGAFFLSGKKLDRCRMIQQVVRNWPQMKELAARKHCPFAFRVPPSGTKITPYGLR